MKRCALRVLLAAAVWSCVAASASAQVFGTPTLAATMPAISGAADGESAHGDFNNDGLQDFVLTPLHGPPLDVDLPVRILLNNGDGTFTEAPSSFFVGGPPGQVQGRKIIVEDFNRDGRDDIFIADHGLDAPPFPGHRPGLLLSRPDNRMQNATDNIPNLPAYTHSAAAGDIDGDGDLDIFLNNGGTAPGKETAFLLNDGSGVFTRSLNSAAWNPEVPSLQAELVDVTGDGIIDLVLGSGNGILPQQPAPVNGYGSVRKGNGDGTFGPPDYDALPPRPQGFTSNMNSLSVIDLDGDGDLDLLGSGDLGNLLGHYVQPLKNNGSGKFTDATAQMIPSGFDDPNGPWIKWTHPLDVNGDCVPDLELEGGGVLTFLPRVGAGYGAPQVIPPNPVGVTFQMFDVDNDGDPDVLSRSNGDTWVLTRNLTPHNCAGLASAVLPATRTVSPGQFATAFFTVVNGMNVAAQNCRLIQKVSSVETQFWFRETNPATNVPIGSPLRRFDVPANGFKTFVFSIAPQAAANNAPIDIKVDCINMPSPAVSVSVNRFSLTGAAGAAADVIPVVSTTSNDGVVRITGTGGSQAFAAASVNVRDNEVLTVKPRYTGAEPLNLFICETNAQGACTTALVPAVSIAMDPNRPRTFTVIAQGAGTAIPADFANKRIVLEFIAAGNAVRGQASVAVTAQ